MTDTEPRSFTPEDLYQIELILDAQISPDGQRVVYVVQRVDRETEKKCSNLWIVPTGQGPARQFTYGDQSDRQPRWSPDGSQIVFLSNRGTDKQSQLYLIPVDGGEARPLTDVKGEFGSYQWSPDGTRLVCSFRAKDAEVIAREEDEGKKKLGVVSRHITRVHYKLDGSGYLPQERWHLWTVDAATGEATQLTGTADEEKRYDEQQPRWSPDGSQIVFVSNRSPDPDLDRDAVDLWLVPAAGGALTRLETPYGRKFNPSFSPDGALVAYLGSEGREEWWRNTTLYVVPLPGSAQEGSVQARNLSGAYDLDVSSNTINDLPGHLPMSAPTWSADGQRIYAQVSRHGSTALYAFETTQGGAEPRVVVGGRAAIGAFSLDEGQSTLACMRGNMGELVQVWVYDLDKEGVLKRSTDRTLRHARKRTTVNQALFERRDQGKVEETWIKSPDGTDLQGWILTPPGFDPAQKYPAILEVHGGPTAMYGCLFMHEFHVLAAQGYVVFFTNPRGSQGYGEEHCKAVFNHFGEDDYADVMAWVDYVQAKPYVDETRMGVTGGSYGGFMTNWIIGHDHRFAAAVTQRSVSNWVSFYGSADMNYSFQAFLGGKPAWEDLENYWRQSPISAIAAAQTPTLVIHSENDMRVPQEQGEQVYVALKRKGVDTELVLFPEEPHGLSREGRTDRRVVRLQHILRWFDRYLKD